LEEKYKPSKIKLREFNTIKPALQKILKGIYAYTQKRGI
jgi:hypothetical protein